MSLWDQLYQMAKQYTQAQQPNTQPSSQNDNGNNEPQSQTPSWAGGEGGAYAYQVPFGAQQGQEQGPSQGQQEEEKTQEVNEENKEDEKKDEKSRYEQYLANSGREVGATYNPAESYLQNSLFGRGIINALGVDEANRKIDESEQRGAREANEQREANQRAQSAGVPESIANTIGNIPLYQLLVPKEEREKQLNDIKSGKTKEDDNQQSNNPDNEQAENSVAQIPDQLIYGKTPQELSEMWEDQIYDLAMNDKDYRAKFDEAGYGDLYGDFARFGTLGEDPNRYEDMESMRAISTDILGLNPDRPDLAIQPLVDMYTLAGYFNDKMTPEEKVQAFMDRHWDDDHIINAGQWMNNEEYQAAHPFEGSTSGRAYSQLLLDNGYVPREFIDQIPNIQNEKWNKLDTKDLAAAFNSGNIINQARSGLQFTDNDMRNISDVFGLAGDRASFRFLPGDSEESDGYIRRDWNPGSKNYSGESIGTALANAIQGTDYSGLDPYNDYGMNLADAAMADAVMAAIEAGDRQHRRIGRKDN